MMKIISTPEVSEESVAFTNNNWSSLMKRGYLMLNNGSNESKINWSEQYNIKVKSFMPMYRGRGLEEVYECDLFEGFAFNRGIGYIPKFDINEINGYEKHLTIVSNSNFFYNDLTKTINKASDMFSYGAFIHQYEKYDMDRSDFIDAFAYCEQIRADYNN
jgi:hypothetical protein